MVFKKHLFRFIRNFMLGIGVYYGLEYSGYVEPFARMNG